MAENIIKLNVENDKYKDFMDNEYKKIEEINIYKEIIYINIIINLSSKFIFLTFSTSSSSSSRE